MPADVSPSSRPCSQIPALAQDLRPPGRHGLFLPFCLGGRNAGAGASLDAGRRARDRVAAGLCRGWPVLPRVVALRRHLPWNLCLAGHVLPRLHPRPGAGPLPFSLAASVDQLAGGAHHRPAAGLCGALLQLAGLLDVSGAGAPHQGQAQAGQRCALWLRSTGCRRSTRWSVWLSPPSNSDFPA